MKPISIKQAKELDLWINKRIGLSTLLMMENAGIRVAEFIKKLLQNKKHSKIAVFCGKGNNAGDGLVTARQLTSYGFRVDVYLLSQPKDLSCEAKMNYDILKKLKIKPKIVLKSKDIRFIDLSSYDFIVDAIFGIGLKGEVKGMYRQVIERINNASSKVISIDVPSGLDADRGLPLGIAVEADYTITLIAPKKGLLINQGPKFSGKVFVEHIGCKI